MMFDLVPFGRRSKEFFDLFEKSVSDGLQMTQGFQTDIVDKGDRYELKADMPGFEKEDIHIETSGDYLTISAQHTAQEESKENNYVRRERMYNSASRSFCVADVKTDAIKAQYKNGVLELILPKKEPMPPSNGRKIHID